MLRFGVIGFGYWGPNIVRTITGIEEATVQTVCDSNVDALKRVKSLYPHVNVSQNASDIVHDDLIDVVAVITPVSTHYPLAKKALENGKHVFVEKPFTQTAEEAQELIEIADQNQRLIMVDHTFLFTGAVTKIKELIDRGELGDLYYYDSRRVSLGLFQQDTNVIWDLASHDISIIDYVVQNKPVSLSACGIDHMESGHENIAYITINYENNMIVHLNVNWLSPVKLRTTIIGGEKKMLVWDDLQADEKIKIYDKGVTTINDKEGINRLKVDYRSGDMWCPKIDPTEALKTEMSYLVECINNCQNPFNDGAAGLRVVQMLQAADESMKNKWAIKKLCQIACA
jgi:predicted dehydrogenase